MDDEGPEPIFPEPAVPQPDIIIPDVNTVSIDTGPKQSKKYVATQMNSAVIAANKVQEKYKKQLKKKSVGKLIKQNKASTAWLKAAGYLDTKDQDAIQYIFIVPKNNVSDNNIDNQPTEPVGDIIDLKETSSTTATQLAAKKPVRKYRILARRKAYKRPHPVVDGTEPENDKISDREDTINTLETIAVLQPGKNDQLAAKKISEKDKNIRETKKSKNIFRLPGEILRAETVETPQGNVDVFLDQMYLLVLQRTKSGKNIKMLEKTKL